MVKSSTMHSEYEWVDYETAMRRPRYDSNRTALGVMGAG